MMADDDILYESDYSLRGDVEVWDWICETYTPAMYNIMKLTNDSFHIKSHSGDGPVAR